MMERVTDPTTSAPSLDDLFRRSVARKPDAEALADPFDKVRVTGQPPRRLTYAQADRAVTNLAAHFIDAGLPMGSVVAIQLPNTIEATLAMLAAVRAGLVVALLPQLWRQAELSDALNRIGARAIVGAARIDGVDHAEIAMNAAADAFSVRHVGVFGNDVPEGMAALDDIVFAPHPLRIIAGPRPEACERHHLRRHVGGAARGAANADADYCRRAGGVSGGRRFPRGSADVGCDAVELRRHLCIDGDLAVVGWIACVSSSLRCRGDAGAGRARTLRDAGRARAAGLAARRGRRVYRRRCTAASDRILAYARAGGVQHALDRGAALQRSLRIRRSWAVRRPARCGRLRGAGAARFAAAAKPEFVRCSQRGLRHPGGYTWTARRHDPARGLRGATQVRAKALARARCPTTWIPATRRGWIARPARSASLRRHPACSTSAATVFWPTT